MWYTDWIRSSVGRCFLAMADPRRIPLHFVCRVAMIAAKPSPSAPLASRPMRLLKNVFSAVPPAVVLPILSLAVVAQLNVLTYHNDNLRTGLNANETILSTANVNVNQFGKLLSFAVDGHVFAQPLYMSNVTIPGKGTHNVVFAATENDTVYAFDADGKSSTPLWHKSLLASGETPEPCGVVSSCFMGPTLGITGTPVIDPGTGTLYLVSRGRKNGKHLHKLHALSVHSGAEMFGGPIVIMGSVPGTGDGSVNGVLSFDSLVENNRSALLLLKGVVYLAFGSPGDVFPYHGWLFGYSHSGGKLHRVSIFSSTPNGSAGGVWSVGSLAADSVGNIFCGTGNGTFDPGNSNFGDSFLKLKPGSGTLTIADYFTPFNETTLFSMDWDAGSGSTLLVPPQTGTGHPNLLIAGTKEGDLDPTYSPQGRIYVVDRNNMGKFHAGDDSQIVQSLLGEAGRMFSSPAFWNQNVYFGGAGSFVTSFSMTNDLLSLQSHSSLLLEPRGANPTISANGTSNGVVWIVERIDNQTSGVLHAFDATNLATELYNSNQNSGRDGLNASVGAVGSATVANGKVYFGGNDLRAATGKLFIFGLLPSPHAGHSIRSKSMRRTSTGEIDAPTFRAYRIERCQHFCEI
jgi:hypothetical protein